MEVERGVVYVLVNTSMPGLVKIGFTMDTAEARARELSSHTGVPTPFKVAWATERIPNPQAVEREVHDRLVSKRANSGREFFRITSTKAISIIEELVGDEHHLAVEAKRIAEDERRKLAIERQHRAVQESIKQRLTEQHRLFSEPHRIREHSKTMDVLVYTLIIGVPAGHFLHREYGLTWWAPIGAYFVLWFWLETREKKVPDPRIEIGYNQVAVDCFKCQERVFIDSRFVQDNPKMKCSCPKCNEHLL
jgi:hypothetical protein